MKTKEIQNKLDKLVDNYKNLDYFFNELEKIFGNQAGRNFYEAVFLTFDDYIENVAKVIGCDSGIICYYIFEGDCGYERLKVCIGGKMYKLNSTKQLAKAIKRSQKLGESVSW